MPDNCIQLKFVLLETILPLRQAVIIAGTNRDTPYFPGDELSDTLHVGALEKLPIPEILVDKFGAPMQMRLLEEKHPYL